ncbi:MAG: redoxin domain-containing protein [Phycisphaerales bacterium]
MSNIRTSPIVQGDAVPDFSLPDQDRKDWRLSDAARKGDVVLCFFPFAFTGTCGTEMQCISREMANWQKKGATVVGVSCDSMFVLKAWANAEGFKHTMLSDQHRKVCQSLGLFWADMNTTHRATVVVGKSADGKMKTTWVQVRQPGSGMTWDEVLAHVA